MARLRRPRRVKNPISVKTKVAKRNGVCTGCGSHFFKGDEVTYVRTKIRRYHPRCTPPDADKPPITHGAPVASAPVLPKTPQEAVNAAMLALENAMVVKAKTSGITDEMEKAFTRYQKLKAMAMRPGSDQEGKTALRLSLIDLIKIVLG